MSSTSPKPRLNRSIGRESSVDRVSQRTQSDIQEVTEIISACNFLCDKYIDDVEGDDISRKLGKYLTRREKFMYERIIAECGTSGDYKRL